MKKYDDLVNCLSNGKEFDENQVNCLPKHQGLYFMVNSKGNIVYVGQATNLKKRINNHYKGRTCLKDNVDKVVSCCKFKVVLIPPIMTLNEIEKYCIQLVKNNKQNIVCLNKQVGEEVKEQPYFAKYINIGIVTNNNSNSIEATIKTINDKIIQTL